MFKFLWIAIFCIGCTTIKNPHQESTQNKKIGQEHREQQGQEYIEGCVFGVVRLIMSLGGTPVGDAIVAACMELYIEKLERENKPAEMKEHEDDPFI